MLDQYGYSTIIGTPAREDDELVGGGSWPRSVLMEMDGWPTNSGGTSIPIVHVRH